MRSKKLWMAQAMQNYHGGKTDKENVFDLKLLNDEFASEEMIEESGIMKKNY